MGVCVWSLFCYATLSVLSGFEIISPRKREVVGVFFYLFFLFFYCWHVAVSVRVPLPHGAVCCFAVCNYDISLSYSITFCASLCENYFYIFLRQSPSLLKIVLFYCIFALFWYFDKLFDKI